MFQQKNNSLRYVHKSINIWTCLLLNKAKTKACTGHLAFPEKIKRGSVKHPWGKIKVLIVSCLNRERQQAYQKKLLAHWTNWFILES